MQAADRSFSRDRTLAAQAGRKGGQATHGRTQQKSPPSDET
ncbi:con-10 family general stress protein [Teichococcus aestuarii]